MLGSWLDVLMVVILVAAIGIGFHQGLLKQAFLLISMYISTVLSAQYYGYLSGLLRRIVPTSSPQITDLLGFFVLLVAFTIVITWLAWTAYKETKLPTTVVIDNMTGSVLGAVIGLFVIALTLMLAQYAVRAPWPEGSTIKFALNLGLSNSALQSAFSAPMPILEAALRPWLPADLPFMTSM
jgi:uncharacterized membrane protein required for colicin V production